MILRESAAKDPLSSDGEWKTVQTSDTKEIVEFHRKVLNYNNGTTPPTDGRIGALMGNLAFLANSINTETSEDTDPPGGEDESANVEGPFIGVRSRSQRKSLLAYYGIERHDRWLFTPLFRGGGQAGEFRGRQGGGGAAPPP